MLWKYTAYIYNVSALSPSVMLIHMEDATFPLILTVFDVQLQLLLYHCYVLLLTLLVLLHKPKCQL